MARNDRRNRRKRRRGRHPGLYKALSAVLILGAVVAACVVFFRVNTVEVRGNRRYTAQEIIDITGVKPGDNLIALRGSAISRELRGKLPYVRTVSIRRQLPDTLVVDITEGAAVAAVAQEGKWWLLDEDVKLLEQAASPGQAAKVTGVTPLAPAVGTYLAAGEEQRERVAWLRELLVSLADNHLIDKLGAVDLSQDYRITFRWDDRLTVHISPTLEKGMSYWLRRFAAAVADSKVSTNQSYTVEIMDDQRIRFIPE